VARHEDIVNTIWDELDHLSDDAFMLYVWSWTNLKCGMAGIYKVARRKLVEGRLNEDGRLEPALAELESDGRLYYLDGVLWCVARVKRLSMISENIAKAVAKDLREIDPANPLVDRFIERYGNHPKLEPHLSLNRPSHEPQAIGSVDGIRRGSPEGRLTLPCQGQGQGQGKNQVVLEVLERLERVTFSRKLPSVNPNTVAKACRDFGDRDLDAESDKFAHYWIDGAGESRRLKDVGGAWRNWLRRSAAPPPSKPKIDRSAYDAKTQVLPA
jgi:hypothetical protein